MANWKESAKKSLENRATNNSTPIESKKETDTSASRTSTTGTTSSGSWKESAIKSLENRGYDEKKSKNTTTHKLTSKEQDVFKKYNLNPTTFTTKDFENWALGHGYEYNVYKEGNGDATFVPKYKGFKKVPTKEEQADFKILSKLAGKEYLKDAAKKYPITFSTATVVSAPLRGVMSIGSNVASTVSTATGNGAVTDTFGGNLVENTDLVRQTITDEHASKWFGGAEGKLGNYGALAYNGLMSVGDTVVTSLTMKGLGKGLGFSGKALNEFTANATSGLLASNSIQSTILQKKKEGYSDVKALAVGFTTGLTEFITEKYSLEGIFQTPTSFIKQGIKSFVFEGMEEGVSDIGSKTFDYIIAGDDSTIKRNINNYISNGWSKSNATKQAIYDSLWETASAAVVGGFSGMAMSGAYHGFGAPEIKQTGKTYRGQAGQIIEAGLAFPDNTNAHKSAEKLQKKGIDKISDYELGKQHIYNVEQSEYEQEQADKITKKLEKNIKKSKNASAETLSVGDTFKDTKTGNTITVIERDGENTVLEAKVGNRTSTKTFKNSDADLIATNSKYEKILSTPTETAITEENSTVETPTVAENTTVENETVTTEPNSNDINLKRVGNYYEVYGNEAVTLANELDMQTETTVINGTETTVLSVPAKLMIEFAEKTDDFNFNFSDNPVIKKAQATETPTVDNQPKTTGVNVGDVYVAKDTGTIYTVASRNAEKTTLYTKTDKGITTQEIDNVLADDTFANSDAFTKTKDGTVAEAKNETVSNETSATDETTSPTKETTADSKKTAVVDAINDTLLPNAKESILKGMANEGKDGGLVEFAGALARMYEKSGTLGPIAKYFSDGGAKVISAIEGKAETKAETTTKAESNEGLKNQSESDTIKENAKSTTDEKAVERKEDSDEQGRKDLLHDDGKRGNNEGARKHAGGILRDGRQNSGRNATERKSFARELIERGQTEQVTIEDNTIELINPEAYNDEMKAMVEDAQSKGKELGFFVGKGTLTVTRKDGRVQKKPIEGIKTSDGKLYVQYDADKAPQTLYKHEFCHAEWLTDKMQKAAKKILGSLTELEKRALLSAPRYKTALGGYTEYYQGDVDKATKAVWEEFVCDVMSGMNDYATKYSDVVNEYWNEIESADTYNVAEYSESIDAGGESKYSFSSIGAAFFGDESISSTEFEKMFEDGSYKEHKGYRDWFKNIVKVYSQSRGIKKLSDSNISGIEKQVEGIARVAIASKKAGFDIFDDGKARSIKDSKKRLLFSSLEPNSDYVTSSDVSTICDKAKNFTEIYDGIVKLEEERNVPSDKRFFNNVDNYFILHKLLADKGLTIPCDECYVQALRKNLTPMANAFIELVTEENSDNKTNAQLYHQDGKDKGNVKKNNAEIREKVRDLLSQSDCPVKLEDLSLQMLTTADGLAELRLEAPLVYESFNSFYGQSKPKMPKKATPFRPGELIAMFTNSKGEIKTSLVNKIKATGGFRLQSYGDFQIENFVDVLQTIFEASMVGLNGHAYTKVPAFLEATDGTNLKRNISIFMYEDNGEWKLDKKNSFPMELEDIYALVASDESGNTGIIAVSQNEDMSAWIMANELLGYGIPFHKSATRMEIVRGRVVKTPDGREILGYANQKDHTKQQTEVYSKTLSDKQKENTKVKKPIDIYSFWDFKNKDNLSKKELIEKNLKKYIDECNKRDYRPKFREYVMDNEAVLDKVLQYAKGFGYVPQNATVEDISFKYGEYTIPYGYYKFLGDFGMFTPDGKAVPVETLSLENYDFDKAVDFFKDAEKLRTNELLQQFENGEVRERYRKMVNEGQMTTEQLEDVLKGKRNEIIQKVVNGETRFYFSEEDAESENESQKNTDINDGIRSFSLEELGYSDRVFDFDVTQSDINQYVEKAYQNGNEKSYIKFLKVKNELKDEVAPDVDITGYSHALRDNDIRHIRNSHGKKTNEKYPVTEADIELIPFIVENYDKVFYKTNANGAPGLIYAKVMPSDVIYYVEAITTEYNNEKLLVNKQMVKTGIDSIPNLYGLLDAINKKQSSSQYLADLKKIREAYVQDVKENYPKDNIAQSPKIVKSDSKGSDINGTSTSKEFNLDDYTIEDMLKWTSKQFDEAYEALGVDKFVVDDDILLDDFELTDDDVEELHGGDFTIDEISEELDEEPEKIEILIRRKGLGESHIEENKMAVMTKERIDRDIHGSGATDKTYAQKYITRISPKDFLDLTLPQVAVDREVFDTKVKGDHFNTMQNYDYESALRNEEQTPYLRIDRATGRVVGHNGRHRLRALEMSGIESVEIEVQFEDEDGRIIKYDAETIPDMAISSQFDTAIETHISNIIPLNETHREEIERTYGEKAHANAEVRYSFAEETDTAYMEAVENGDLETQEKIIYEAAKNAGYPETVYHGTTMFGFTKPKTTGVEANMEWSPFFAVDSLETAGTYSATSDVKEISEAVEPLDEDTVKEIKMHIDAEIHGLVKFCNQKIGIKDWVDYNYFATSLNDCYRDLEKGVAAKKVVADFRAFADDLFYTLERGYFDTNYNEKEFAYEAFQESEEYDKLSNMYYSYVYYLSSGLKELDSSNRKGIYELFANTDGFLEVDADGRQWNMLFSKYGGNTRAVAKTAFDEGYKGVKITNVFDDGGKGQYRQEEPATVYIFFNPKEQTKSADLVTYDDDGNVIPPSERFNKKNDDFRWSFAEEDNLETQRKIENIAREIGSHEEFIEVAKQNTKEFVGKIKENKSLQKRLNNAKRQMLLTPSPVVNITQAGKITKEILAETESTLKANDLKDEVMSIYNEYFAEIKKAKGVEAKVKEANDNMMARFGKLAIDIADSSVAYTESEEYELLKSYVKNTRIQIPEDAKSEVHYAEFRKSHMGTFNLTNDGLPIDRAYQELCEMFPGIFSEEVTSPADQLNAIAEALESNKPYAYNPHEKHMADAIDYIVYMFASEVDGLAVVPKTKAQKIAEKGVADKEMALDKERTEFERKLGKHKEQSENTIRKLQKKIDDADYVRYWEKRLSKEEKAQAIQQVRDKRDIAILKTKIRNIVSDMKKNLDKTEKNGGYPKELVKAAADVCSAIDFHTGKTNKDGTPTKTTLKLDSLKAEYEALESNPNYDFASEYSKELSDKIENLRQEVRGKRIVDLSKSELENLKDILSEISTRLSEARKQIGQAEARANVEIATEIINSLKSDKKAISEIRNQLLKVTRLTKENGKAFVVNAHRIFEMIANYDRNSAWWKLYEQILHGSRKVAKFTMDATIPFDELTDGGGNEIAFYDFRTKMHKTGIKYQDGTDVMLPKSIICEIVMLWDRKQGRKHLEAGGVKIPDLKLFNQGRTADALALGKMTNAITQSDITRLRGMLDSYDKAWIERSRHFFNKVAKDAINEVSMQLVGRELAKDDNYIRIYVNSDFTRKDIGKNETDITIEGHGSLKETMPEAKNPLIVRGLHENVYEHIDFASKYYGLAIPIRNFNKVYGISINGNGNPDSVQNTLGSIFGPKIRDGVVVQTIKDLQSPRHRELSFFNKVRGKWLGATFYGNVRSMFKQTTSYWTASSILGEDSLAKGMVSYNTHRKQTKAEIAKYSGTLYKRSQGLSTTELGDRANRKRLAGLSSKTTKFVNNKLPVLRKIPEWIRPENWLQSMDCAVSSTLWDACKFEVAKTMKETDEGYMQAVADLYERVIEETQSNYDVLHRPEILKSTNPLWQTLGMFQNDNLQQSGIMYGAFSDLQAKRKAYKADKSSVNEQNLKDAQKRMAKAIRSRIYSSMWLTAVTVLGNVLLRKFKPYIDDEEKEITAKSSAEQMLLNMGEDMLSVFAPVVGQLATKAIDTFTEGYDFLSDPAFDVLEDFIKATSKIYKAYEKDEDVLKAWVDSIPAISNMTGVPAKNIMDLFNGIKGYIGDIKELDFAHDLTDYTSGNKSFYNYDDLASYIVSGDKEKETQLLEYYSENGKAIVKSSLTKALKPAYVQMYIDSPQEAYNVKRKLILDYDYTEKAISEWAIAVYLDNVFEEPEYASEIAIAIRKEKDWTEIIYSPVRSYYKGLYKDGEDTKPLDEALARDFKFAPSNMQSWKAEAENEKQKNLNKQNADKAKYK